MCKQGDEFAYGVKTDPVFRDGWCYISDATIDGVWRLLKQVISDKLVTKKAEELQLVEIWSHVAMAMETWQDMRRKCVCHWTQAVNCGKCVKCRSCARRYRNKSGKRDTVLFKASFQDSQCERKNTIEHTHTSLCHIDTLHQHDTQKTFKRHSMFIT